MVLTCIFLTYPRLWCLRGPLLSQCLKAQLWLSMYWAPYCAHYSHVIAQQSIRAIILWLLQMMQLLQLMMSQCRGETWKNLLAGVMQTICGKFGEDKSDCGGRRRPHILQSLLIRGKAVVTVVKYLTLHIPSNLKRATKQTVLLRQLFCMMRRLIHAWPWCSCADFLSALCGGEYPDIFKNYLV